MSDTATQTPTTGATADQTTEAKDGETRKRRVEYTLEVVDHLPEFGQRQSPLEDSLNKVREAVEAGKVKPDTWVVIAKYPQSTASGAAANVLRQRHGNAQSIEGWEIQSRRIEGGDLTGLFVRFNPAKVVSGAREEWDRVQAKRKAELEAKRAARAAEANKSEGNKAEGNGTGTASTPAPGNPGPNPAEGEDAKKASAATASTTKQDAKK